MPHPIYFTIGALVIFAGAILIHGYYKRTHPLRAWVKSTPAKHGDNLGSTEPFYGWWIGNRMGMGEGKILTLDTKAKTHIDHVTDELKDEWKYVLDLDWKLALSAKTETRVGDCKAYAYVAARMLIERGIDPGCMTLAFGGHTVWGWHCVLLIDTDCGAYIVSVGERFAMPWQDMPLTDFQRAGSDGMYRRVYA